MKKISMLELIQYTWWLYIEKYIYPIFFAKVHKY